MADRFCIQAEVLLNVCCRLAREPTPLYRPGWDSVDGRRAKSYPRVYLDWCITTSNVPDKGKAMFIIKLSKSFTYQTLPSYLASDVRNDESSYFGVFFNFAEV